MFFLSSSKVVEALFQSKGIADLTIVRYISLKFCWHGYLAGIYTTMGYAKHRFLEYVGRIRKQ